MKFTKIEKSWIMYDWANSSYATIMLAAIFPIYFTSVCSSGGVSGDTWWGIGTSIATATVAILAPIVGATADFIGYKKKLFSAFLALGLIFTLYSAFASFWQLMLVGYVLSHIGFCGANVLYDSFLTDVTTADNMDSVSSTGFAMGYLGGSTIPFLFSIALMLVGPNFGIDSILAIQISVVITAVWWGVFSIPMLHNVHQIHGIERKSEKYIAESIKNIIHTAKDIMKNKALLAFILAYFLYIDGVNTVISMASIYGATLGLDTVKMILALLVTQLVAVPCSLLFGKISKKYSSVNLILFAIGVYVIICLSAFIMGFGLEENFLTITQAEIIFWIMATLTGTVQGGIQAISRSFFAKLVPPEKSGEYFGFFDIFGKFAAVTGPALYALVKALTNRSSVAVLSIVLLFIVGFIIILKNIKILREAEKTTR